MGKHMEKERVHSRGPRPASFSGSRFYRPITPGTRGNTEQLPPPRLSLFSALLLVWLEVAKRPFFLLCLCPSSTCSEWHITKLFDFEQQFFFFFPMAIHGSDPVVQVIWSCHVYIRSWSSFLWWEFIYLFYFLVHVPDLTAVQFKNIREYFFNVLLCIFSGPQFHCCFCISAVVVIQIRTCTAPFP